MLSSFLIYIGPAFADFLQNIETILEKISPPATLVPQDVTLTYVVLVLDTLNYFLLLTYVSLRVSNFVLVSHFWHIFLSTSDICLGCQFLAHSVFIPHILSIFYDL